MNTRLIALYIALIKADGSVVLLRNIQRARGLAAHYGWTMRPAVAADFAPFIAAAKTA